ncbi:putative PurR-regulated permease PerM [Microbacterium sp. AG1240]|uniref:AI-2E family transporter n=1 Tax=Microbacterium sp. AG1240 TaxID=2183992 RepID=UPI000EAB7F9C|nr:AI-2E family transporter [Microbacterium sp. AG1240]RKT31695.1 putative PurR-regulated permease PerM [Microbacterium sp. AG1240]
MRVTPRKSASDADPTSPGADGVHSEGRSPNTPIWANLASPFGVGFFITLGGLAAVLLGIAISNLSTVIIYVAFALFAALGLDPLVRFLGRRGLSRAWSIVVVSIAFAGVLVGILLLIIPTVVRQVTQFISDAPGLVSDFMRSDVYQWLEANFGDSVTDIVAEVQKFLTDPGNIAAIGGGVLQVGITIGTGISGIIIVIVLSLYFLASLPNMKTAFVRLVPARNRAGVADMTEQITDSVGGYLMGMVVLAFCNAVVAFFLLLFLGFPFPALMAVVAFCITLIPLVGSVLFWAIGTILVLFVDPIDALIFAGIYLVYMQLEAYVLTPRVMNRTISVPGSLVVIGALVGGTLLGLLGALVAIPVTASILLIVKQVVVPRQDAKK